MAQGLWGLVGQMRPAAALEVTKFLVPRCLFSLIRPGVFSLSTLAIMSQGHSWSHVGRGQCCEGLPVLSQWQYYTLEKKKRKKGSKKEAE